MTEKLSYAVFETPYGWVGLLGSSAGLRHVALFRPLEKDALAALGDEAAGAVMSTAPFVSLIARLQSYFSGHHDTFPDKIDFSDGTPFQRKVWQAACRIPYGQTRSYGWVARQIGKPGAARAVGQALGKNPFPIIIPCHRVVAADGGLGGFTGGLDKKKTLLQLEKTPIIK